MGSLSQSDSRNIEQLISLSLIHQNEFWQLWIHSGGPQWNLPIVAGSWGGLERSWITRESGPWSNACLLVSMELCQYFHNWHGTIVSTHYHICTALGWSGLSNFFSQNMMARQAAAAAAAAPGSCLKRKIPGFHLRSPKSKSAFWHDPQVISVPLTILEVMVYKIGLNYL